MKNKHFVIVTLLLVLLLSGLFYLLYKNNFLKKESVVKNKESKTVVADIGKVSVEYPKSEDSVGCNFDVKGSVPKEWLDDNSFLVKVRVGESVVYQTMAVIENSDMNDGLSRFNATISCGAGCVGKGEILLVQGSGDNNVQEYAVPVTFESTCSVGEM